LRAFEGGAKAARTEEKDLKMARALEEYQYNVLKEKPLREYTVF
jgi:hypothetical protein